MRFQRHMLGGAETLSRLHGFFGESNYCYGLAEVDTINILQQKENDLGSSFFCTKSLVILFFGKKATVDLGKFISTK